MMRVPKLPTVLATLSVVLAGMLFGEGAKPAVAEGLFDDVNLGLLSIGGRAAYFDPKEGDANWFGGGQLRLHPFKFLAVEGSVDFGLGPMWAEASSCSSPNISPSTVPIATSGSRKSSRRMPRCKIRDSRITDTW